MIEDGYTCPFAFVFVGGWVVFMILPKLYIGVSWFCEKMSGIHSLL